MVRKKMKFWEDGRRRENPFRMSWNYVDPDRFQRIYDPSILNIQANDDPFMKENGYILAERGTGKEKMNEWSLISSSIAESNSWKSLSGSGSGYGMWFNCTDLFDETVIPFNLELYPIQGKVPVQVKRIPLFEISFFLSEMVGFRDCTHLCSQSHWRFSYCHIESLWRVHFHLLFQSIIMSLQMGIGHFPSKYGNEWIPKVIEARGKRGRRNLFIHISFSLLVKQFYLLFILSFFHSNHWLSLSIGEMLL